MMTPPLQPLRIPAGWTVVFHDFREVDATPEAIAAMIVREDLLQLSHRSPARVVDVGWYGTGEDAAFTVVCIEPDFSGRTLESVRTRDRQVAVATVERFLATYSRQ